MLTPNTENTEETPKFARKMSRNVPKKMEGRATSEDMRAQAVMRTWASVCYQCGTCSGGCPVAAIVPEYHIRKMIKAAREGKIDLNNKFLWFCSTCYLCYERCPQDVKPIQIIHAITNLISKRGCAPTPIKDGNRNILTTGRIVEVSRLTQQKRKELGLLELKSDVSEDFRKIAKLTGLEKMIE
ncbi:MAG: 4Fe-4S dicluster domain-containing protein [Gammaproteobacteria bacterium]|nr:4Fe-4S dicluster domain-containing protein [Candidatus Bathyarchaeota archaeon]NIW11897.1 4Fe-4S dicluster domain-containing protein [Gammaproteobacteria bacterium]